MTAFLSEPFFAREGDAYVATVSARGPWDDRFCHGGPPSALLLRVLTDAARARDPNFSVARLTTGFLKPVPLGRLTVEIDDVTGGRTVVRARARLCAGEVVVMEAEGLFVRRNPDVDVETAVRPGSATAPWPAPTVLTSFTFPFFTATEAYHRAIDVRLIDAPWGTTPVRLWAKVMVPLVGESEPSAEESVVVLADAESGMGPPVDPMQFSYLNPDLTVYFARRPRPGWVGFEICSHAGDDGIGLSESALRDDAGVFGQSAQSLVLASRG